MIGVLTLNGRLVDLGNLSLFRPQTAFEHSTISFITKWMSNDKEFSIQTSGSTGKPKNIVLTRKQMEVSAQATNSFFGLAKEDTIFLCLNTAYIAGQMMLVRAMVGQLNVIAIEPNSKPILPERPSIINFMAFVPLQIKNLLKEGSLDTYRQLKAIIIGGASIDNELECVLETLATPAYATFGMTETVSHIALRKLNGKDKSQYYHALPGIKLGLEDGCLTIEGEVTEFKKIVTTDLVYFKNEHTFKWLGRKDNVINSGGVKLHIDQIEQRLHPILKRLDISNRFLCAKKKDALLGEKLVLVVEGHLDQVNQTHLLSKVIDELPKYWAPKEIIIIENLPQTPTGKPDRKALDQRLIKGNL
ncbi:MAG: AMP-binding protein [Bacteroidota bacterium]